MSTGINSTLCFNDVSVSLSLITSGFDHTAILSCQ